ncbi:hypothetical protein [Candidatus Protochlamydia amoebophila]|uniref:Uncharacterized protein n=1 Tax=Candidatus Protochlamydia amoebophila TaxID=362787 RepID=A0A0C1JLA8_9BACT|nr:hypothetical protein [Candidatus Protochlamydia amoebophila]KIC71371.1 hypothetical protein DB44_DT00060 [Candidatus Protochlamydia amoebophila]
MRDREMRLKVFFIRLSLIFLMVMAVYGLGRGYFYLTGGFTLANITSNFPFNPQWEVKSFPAEEQIQFLPIFDQPYHYLGKGCQSYVFLSEDGRYVIKFFKYQRFRLQPWLLYAPPLPAIIQYRKEKEKKKWDKLDGFVKSWKVAFENLKQETGLIFVHLNKTENLQKQLVIYDKIGRRHQIDLDQMEFCVQCRATMLCDKLLEFKSQKQDQQAKLLIVNLLKLILSEYHRGLADNDHALMQNTGVVNEMPIHIDVGQFVKNEVIKDPTVYHQELFTKTYKFKIWLNENYPELASFLEAQLKEIIGPAYWTMQPKFRPK